MSLLKTFDEAPGYLEEDYPTDSQKPAAFLQVPAGSISRTPSASSGVGDDSPICSTDATGKEHGINGRLAFAIAAAVVGSSFQHGYNTGVVNAPQKLIEEWIRQVIQGRSPPETIADQREVTIIFSIFVSIFCIGGMIGGCATGYVADKFGRKGGLLLNIILVLFSCILQGCSKAASSYELLIAGRFLIGINAGLNAGLAPMYVAEISPARRRGATGTAYQLVITISIVLAQLLGHELVLGTENRWPLLLTIPIFLAIFQLLTLPFCPETPKYVLVSQRDEAGARRALVWLRGTTDVFDEMEDMKNEFENMRTPGVSLKEMLYNPMLRLPLIIAVTVMIGQQFSGINAVMFYSTKIFKMAGMDNESAQYATLATGLVNVGMTIVSLVLVEKAGRKTLLLFGFQGMCVISILFVICLSFVEKSTAISYISVALVMLFVMMFATGPGSIPWFLVSELFSQSARPIATSVAVATNWLANFIVGLAFLPLQDLLKGYVFIIFAILLGFFSIFVRLKVPETKNQSIEEILAIFRQRSYT